MDRKCRWSYFFVDSDEAKLAALARELQAMGYENHGFLTPEGEGKGLFLRMDRIEVHTVESLHARNLQLAALAERFGVNAYDGMDVGAIDGP